jgi:hypothetical protein
MIRDEIEIQEHAKSIANIISDIDTDYRGDLLLQVGLLLTDKDQFFTGRLLYKAGQAYGLSDRTR